MLDGERSIRRMASIPANPIAIASVVDIGDPLPGCCSDFLLNVLADASGITFKNDVNTIIYWFDPIVASASMVLKKWIDNTWVNQATIADNTYGTYGAIGYYVNNENQKFIKLEIEWAKVLAVKGEGTYKITTTYTAPIFGSSSVDSYDYCLRTYSTALADGTVKLEYWLSGVTGDIEEDTKIKDFGTQNIYNSFRLKGFFGYPKATYKEEDIEYNNGQRVYVEDEQTPTYKLKLLLLPFFIHEILRTDFMMADTLAITDYNSKNNGSYVQKYVRKDSGYEPEWYELQSNFASVELQFKQQYNRFRKLR